jgi:hypothetical protein
VINPLIAWSEKYKFEAVAAPRGPVITVRLGPIRRILTTVKVPYADS